MKEYIQTHIFNSTTASFNVAMKTQMTAHLKFSYRLISAHQEATYTELAKKTEGRRERLQAKIQKYENFLSKLRPYISDISWIPLGKIRISCNDEQTYLFQSTIRKAVPMVNIIDCQARNVDLRGEIIAIQINNTKNYRGNHNDRIITPPLAFVNCRFSGSNLSYLDLSHAVMRRIKLNRADLNHAILNYADLEGADLRNANLQGAKLLNANLFTVKLKGANLSGAIFTMDFTYYQINLDEVNIEGAKIFLKLPFFWDDAKLDKQLNHIDGQKKESLLTHIDKIDDKFIEEKIDCFHQVIDSLKRSGVNIKQKRFPREALLTFFTTKKKLMEDSVINKFVCKVFAAEINYIENGKCLSRYNPSVLSAMLDILSSSINDDRNEFYMLKNNNFFIALIALTVYSTDQGVRNKSQRLYQLYLTLKPVKPLLQQLEFGNEERKVDWSDKETNNYILINKNVAMIISHENLTNMLTSSEDNFYKDWYRFSLYIDGKCQPLENVNLDHLFTDVFKIFMKSYISSTLQVDFSSFLQMLNLAEYEKKFILALAGKHVVMREKLIKTQDQRKLSVLFENKFKISENGKTITIKSNHYKEILQVFKLQNSNHKMIAQKLFCCSIMFVKYSSDRFFGSEFDSPLALRYYASALMHKANELDSTVTGLNYLRWNNCLLGLEEAYTCAYFLSEAMLQHAKTHFHHIVCTTMPPAWG